MKKHNTHTGIKIKLGIAIVASILLISCGKSNKPTTDTGTAINVKVATALNQEIGKIYEYSGKVNAGTATMLSTRIMGQITSIKVDIGDQVKKGQVLLTIRSNDIAAKKAQVEANIIETETAYASAEKDYNRLKTLFEQESASQKELDDITTHYKMMEAKLKAVKQMKLEVDEMLRYAVIRAPFNGYITAKMANTGDMANPGMPLLSVESEGAFEVTAKIPETEINRIEKGKEVSIQLRVLNHPKMKGVITQVSQSGNISGSQYDVKIQIEPNEQQESQIRSGMFANVQIQSGNENCIMIPANVLIKRGQLTGIWAVSQQNEALLRWIRTGKQQGDQVEILSGLSHGEKYIAKAEGRLHDGIKLNITN